MAVAGLCLYPSLLDNPVRGILQKIEFVSKETVPERGRWFVSGITNKSNSSFLENKTLVMELFLALMNFGLKNSISNFICLSKSNIGEILTELGVPPLHLYPRVTKEPSGLTINKIEVSYTALRFLEKRWNEEITNFAY